MSDASITLDPPVDPPQDRALPKASTGAWYRWVSTVDHKEIGLLYIFSSVLFFLIGGVEALLMRFQLSQPANHLLSPQAYSALFTLHGTTMIFLVVVPVQLGIAVYMVPLMIGARDMALPRLNALSFWLTLFGGLLLYASLATGHAPAAGWFSYAPLSEQPYSYYAGMGYWLLALLVIGIGTLTNALNLILTIFSLRAPGMTIRRVPLFVWMMLVDAFLIIFALPALNGALVMLLADRFFGGHFFRPDASGSAALWQHFFWGFGHPEVYIMVIPAWGMISEVIPVFSRKPIFGYTFVAMSTVAIGLLSFGVWMHHMFTMGLPMMQYYIFSAASMLIAVPTGVKIFAWIGTMWGGSIRFTVSMLFAAAFLIQFTLGGLSGVMFAAVPVDWQLQSSYFLVAHMHYVLFGGSAFAIFAGVYYWFPKMTGRMLSERLGKWHFWLTVIGFNGTFMVQHILGVEGMPRRVYTYPDLPGWFTMNLISTIGSVILGGAVLLFLWNVLWSLKHGAIAGDNPWEGWSLEWATTSPPPAHKFELGATHPGPSPSLESGPSRAANTLAVSVSPDAAAADSRELRALRWMTDNLSRACMAFFLASESIFFIILIAAFIFFHRAAKAAGGPEFLHPLATGLYSFFLFASSFTAWRAVRAADLQQLRRAGVWLLATILLGTAFLVFQGREFASLVQHNVTISSGVFGSTFFVLTGFHGLHVAAGLVLFCVLLGLVMAKKLPRLSKSLATAVLYWHFVDVVWVVIYLLVYLWGDFVMFWKQVMLAWDWEPSIILGCCALLIGYAILSRFRATGRTRYFVAGVMVMFLALVSPIDALSDDYLFSADMFQHLLLSQVVPPLLLLGIPAEWWRILLGWHPLAAVESLLRKPLIAWFIGIVALWVWHWPPLFGLALQNQPLHILQHLCFMVTGCIFWWPVVTPLAAHRLPTFPAVFYLFTACTISSLLGIFITFSSANLYPFYGSGADPLNILAGVRDRLSLHEDQQLGGLLMWVPCCLIYASAILVTLGRWQDSQEAVGEKADGFSGAAGLNNLNCLEPR